MIERRPADIIMFCFKSQNQTGCQERPSFGMKEHAQEEVKRAWPGEKVEEHAQRRAWTDKIKGRDN